MIKHAFEHVFKQTNINGAFYLNLVHVQNGRFSVEETTGFNLDVIYVYKLIVIFLENKV